MTNSVPIILLAAMLTVILACGGGVPSATGGQVTPTVVPPDPTTTNSTDIVILTAEPKPIAHTPAPVIIPTDPGVTPVPTIEPPLVPFPVELTEGLDALVACGGNDPEYWFSVGPPDITPELAACILEYLEDN